MVSSNERLGAIGPVTLKYFNFKPGHGGASGRGGALRFLLLATGIAFEEDKVAVSDWPETKQKLVASGVSPAGYLPVLTVNGKHLTEHHAIMRRFSAQLGLYGGDVERDYLIDSLAEATTSWRWHWVSSLEGGEVKDKYVSTQRAEHYKAFEQLLEQHGASGAFAVSGAKLSFADVLLFSQLWDDCVAYGSDLLKASPRLLAFYKAFSVQPRVAAWCEDANPAVFANTKAL
jgi:glutathione S-transferase